MRPLACCASTHHRVEAPSGSLVAPITDAMDGVKRVYVLDCGGQYAHLIASRVRKHEALSVIVSADTPASELVGATVHTTRASPVCPLMRAADVLLRCWCSHRLRRPAVCV